jgi:branched-chain amino acid transport system permease protein
MSQLFELTLSGLALGCIYALLATGFVIVFKATNVINFSHASIVMLGAYLVASWQDSLGFWPAIAASAAVTAAVAAAMDVLFVAPLRRRAGTTDGVAILTIALNILLGTQLARMVGTDILPSGAPWGAETTEILGVAIPQARLAAAAVALAVMGAFYLAFTRSDWGIAMRSAAADPEAAALMGIRLSRVAAGAWAVAGLLAAIGGAFLISFPSSGVSFSTGILALAAVPVAVVGGLDSTKGALLGGLLIGVAQTLASGYQDQLAFLGRGLGEVVPYAVLFVVLLWRPNGLFGTKEMSRV